MSQGMPASRTSVRTQGALEAIAGRILGALSAVRVWSLSLHDEHADVLWLNEGVLGPDEHEAVRASLEVFAGEGAPKRHQYEFGDGRIAVTLRAGHPGGSVLGLAMIIVERKALASPRAPLLAEGSAGLQGAIDEYAKWLADDVSATQARLRALQDPAVHELQLELEPIATRATPNDTPESGEAASAANVPANRGASIDPALDRHFAALRTQPIVLYVQRLEPINAGSRIRRFETLLRTDSEHGRTHAPTAMLEAAARRGLGSVVDRRVVTELVIWLARNPDVWRTSPVALSVNLSATALIDRHFLKFVELCLSKADLPRGMIAFELDANLCAQHLGRTMEVAEFLAALGCTIILDDFTLHDGHLELLGLKGLRMLKLHPTLTSSIGEDKRRQAIVGGIAQMACILGMHTCAKAIESTQTQRWLAALRVDFAQGFGFSKPRPLAELPALLA